MTRPSRPRRVLVTGCAGFIGSHVVEHLLAAGLRVIGVDSFDDFYDPRIKVANVQPALRNRRFTLHVMDLANAAAVSGLAARIRPDAIVHLAGMAGVRRSLEEPGPYIASNVVATQNLLDAFARGKPVPIVFAGSSSVYGNDTPPPFDESAACARPPSPYAATKRAAELLCSTAHDTCGAPITVLRFFTVYGPRQRPDLAIRRFTAAMLRGEEIVVHGDGSMARDYTHVHDIVRGIFAAMREREGFRIVNLGSSSPVSILDLIAKLRVVLRVVPRVRFVDRPAGEMDVTFANIRRAAERWSWRPQITLDDGLADFARWLEGEHKPQVVRAAVPRRKLAALRLQRSPL